MQPYRQSALKFINKEIDWDSDAITFTLHTATYTPNLDTHAYVSDLTNELTTAGGYTVGGITAAGKTQAYTAANSWATQRAATTAYALDDIVRPAAANGFLYRAAVAGTTGAGLPTYPTVLGTTVADGGVTWECVGSGIVVLDCNDPSWAAATFGPCRYMVCSDRTPGTAATQPLIGITDFLVNKTGGGGAFTINIPTVLGAIHIVLP